MCVIERWGCHEMSLTFSLLTLPVTRAYTQCKLGYCELYHLQKTVLITSPSRCALCLLHFFVNIINKLNLRVPETTLLCAKTCCHEELKTVLSPDA